jgi:hypothetical protein
LHRHPGKLHKLRLQDNPLLKFLRPLLESLRLQYPDSSRLHNSLLQELKLHRFRLQLRLLNSNREFLRLQYQANNLLLVQVNLYRVSKFLQILDSNPSQFNRDKSRLRQLNRVYLLLRRVHLQPSRVLNLAHR